MNGNSSAQSPRNRTTGLRFETFEPRILLAADFLDPLIPVAEYDGSGNNLSHAEWGSVNQELVRLTDADYSDGFNQAAGTDRASAREISNVVASQDESIENNRNLTDMLWLFGQFIDHDITLSENAQPSESMNIEVPAGDTYFDPLGTGSEVIQFNRSVYHGGTSTDDIREQYNEITAFLDGSVIYGSSSETLNSLREFSGGRLIVSDGDLLPIGERGFFEAGDIRSNENIALTAMHTIWVREHNRIADSLSDSNPSLSDEDLFQTARAMVRAELQSITFNEFLPAILGKDAISRYPGYDPTVNPNISNEFSTAAYRFGHTMLSSELLRLNSDGTVADEGNIALLNAFFSPTEIQQNGVDSILQGLAAQTAQEIDTQVVDDIRNFLFGPPGAGGFDLAALNIQRGRDHGLPDYNQVRVELGLEPVSEFSEITSDPELQEKLRDAYGTVDSIDLWVGGLAEDAVDGSSLGQTFRAILSDQFSRLRDGDRFWYQNLFQGQTLLDIESVSLADVIERNSNVENLQENVFFASDSQPENHHEPLTIHVPGSSSPVRVMVRDGAVELHFEQRVERTLLLSDTRLLIRGTGAADHLTVDLRDPAVLQLKRIVVNAGGGHDRVRIVGVHDGYEGEIRINGQKGHDQLRAQHVDAVIAMYGGAGRDTLMGGNRSDRLHGGSGDDRIFGGSGDDVLSGSHGDDRIDGQAGNDRLNERLFADTELTDRKIRSELGDVDRLFEMEEAIFLRVDQEHQLDASQFHGRCKVRQG